MTERKAMFLMYRVELKVSCGKSPPHFFKQVVPNVPCGVERTKAQSKDKPLAMLIVPNVPCGVERVFQGLSLCFFLMAPFLMYRVELKVP